MLFDNAYNIVWIRYSQENIQEKFPYFLRFCKTIKVENKRDYGSNDVFEDASMFLEDEEENLSLLDLEFYEILREGNVITEEDAIEYIRKEKRMRSGNEIKVYNTQDGYILCFDQRVVHVEDVIRTALKLYYRIDDEVVYYIEPLFYAILEKDLEMNESMLYNYTIFIKDIISNSDLVLDKVKTALREFTEIEEVKEFLKRDIPSDAKFLSYAILDFLYKIIEKMRKSPKRSNQLYNYLEIFKAIFSRVKSDM
jgi:hypothetical protein